MDAAAPTSAVMSFVDLLSKYGFPIVLSAIVLVFLCALGWLGIKKIKSIWFPLITPTVGESSGMWRHPVKRGPHDRTIDSVGFGDDGTASPDGRRATDAYSKSIVLTDHYFFGSVEHLAGSGLDKIRCGCEGRTLLLKRMLKIYLKAWRDEIHTLIVEQAATPNFNDGSIEHSAKLEAAVNACLQRIHNQFHEGWAREGIPIPAVGAFNRWHAKVMDIQIEHTRNVARGMFFGSNRVRLAAILCQHTAILHILVTEAGTVLKRLNGDLTGVVFEGVEIVAIDGHCDDDEESNHIPIPYPSAGSVSAKHPTTKKKHRSGEFREAQ